MGGLCIGFLFKSDFAESVFVGFDAIDKHFVFGDLLAKAGYGDYSLLFVGEEGIFLVCSVLVDDGKHDDGFFSGIVGYFGVLGGVDVFGVVVEDDVGFGVGLGYGDGGVEVGIGTALVFGYFGVPSDGAIGVDVDYDDIEIVVGDIASGCSGAGVVVGSYFFAVVFGYHECATVGTECEVSDLEAAEFAALGYGALLELLYKFGAEGLECGVDNFFGLGVDA